MKKIAFEKREFINHDILSSLLVLLDEEQEAESLDPDFQQLESLIRVEPSIFGPLEERLNLIRRGDIHQLTGRRMLIRDSKKKVLLLSTNQSNNAQSDIALSVNFDQLWRSLRSGDMSKAWNTLVQGSFITLVPNIHFLHKDGWEPVLEEDKQLFETILEFIDQEQVEDIKDLLYELFYTSETSFNLKSNGIMITLSPNAYYQLSELQYTNENILHEYRLSEPYYDAMHTLYQNLYIKDIVVLRIIIPLKSQNLLTEHCIPLSTADLEIGHGLPLYIHRYGIGALLRPVSQLSTDEYNWVFEKIDETEKLVHNRNLSLFYALKALISYHAQQRFQLNLLENYTTDQVPEVIQELNKKANRTENKKTSIFLGIDFGNNKTTLTAINSETGKTLHGKDFVQANKDIYLDYTPDGVVLPSLIYYATGGQWIIGKKALEKWDNNQTFKQIKKSLQYGYRSVVKIHQKQIFAPQAAYDFLNEINHMIDFDKVFISNIGIAYATSIGGDYQNWLLNTLSSIASIPLEKIFSIDEASASALGLYDKIPQQQIFFLLDIGESNTKASILKISTNKDASLNIKIFSRFSDNFGSDEIDKALFLNALQIKEKNTQNNGFITNSELLLACQYAKHKIHTLTDETKILLTVKPNSPEYFTFSGNDIQKWLEKEKFQKRLRYLINKTFEIAIENDLAVPLPLCVVTGEGSKFFLIPNILEDMQNYFLKSVIFPDLFSVSRGITKAMMGFNVNTALTYDIGVFSKQGRIDFYKMLIPEGTPIPLKEQYYEIKSDINYSTIFFDLLRHHIKNVDNNTTLLIFDNKGQPKILNQNKSYEYIEPLRQNPIKIFKDSIIGISITNEGRILLKIQPINKDKPSHTELIGTVL